VVANAIDIRVRPHGRSELLELLELLINMLYMLMVIT
jgi:hypothetical protein